MTLTINRQKNQRRNGICRYGASYLDSSLSQPCRWKKSGQPSAVCIPTRSPKRSCRSCGSSADASATTHPESGQARVPSGFTARFADASPPQSRQLGFSPLGTFAAQGTSALTATRRRDCGRQSRPQTRSSDAPLACPWRPSSRPAPCSRTFKGKAVTVGSRQTLHFSPWRSFVPGFASVNRAGSSPPSLPWEVQ